ASLGVIGAGLLLLTLILGFTAAMLRRPELAARPALQIARPAAVFGAIGRGRTGQAIAGSGDSLRFATDTLRDGSRRDLVAARALVAVLGLIAGRNLRPHRPAEKPDVDCPMLAPSPIPSLSAAWFGKGLLRVTLLVAAAAVIAAIAAAFGIARDYGYL